MYPRVLQVLLPAVLAGSGCMDCEIEAYVDEHFAEHDAFDCKFAHQFATFEREVVGAEHVRTCIFDALADGRAFVGGVVLSGIDSASYFALLGTASGTVSLVHEYHGVSNYRSIQTSRCSSLVPAEPTGFWNETMIGLECVGKRLETECGE